jgi:hypothetical protein
MQRKWSSVGDAVQTTHSEALENVKSINRELLVAAGANIPERAAHALNEAREFVLVAVRALQANHRTGRVPAEELPVAQFKAAAERAERKFDALFQPIRVLLALQNLSQMPSKLNGRRRRQCLGCPPQKTS